jgi:GNAT superfamily N-acetyltransferase
MPFVTDREDYPADLARIAPLSSPGGFSCETVELAGIPALYRYEGFRNAIQYDLNHPRPDVLVVLAKKDGHVVGMAGASADCAIMWQIGVDVLPDHRSCGLAAYIVNRLTLEILTADMCLIMALLLQTSLRSALRTAQVFIPRGYARIREILTDCSFRRRVD